MNDEKRLKLRNECVSALACLYIAVDRKVAEDVNKKVMNYVEALENILDS